MTPSKYQQAIFDWIQNGSGHGVVEAKAGSGKTTTAVEAIKLIPRNKRCAFVAFNKSIADELRARVPGHCSALTLNGLGHRAWSSHVGRVTLASDKTRRIMNEVLTHAEQRAFGGTVRKLVDLAKAHGLVPDRVTGAKGLVPDSVEAWEAIIKRYDIELESDTATPTSSMHAGVISLARRVLAISCERLTVIDFNDQLYFPVIFGAPVAAYDWLFVDEAQDLNPIQHALVERAIAPGGRIVAIGDSHQSIYAFRGADLESMQRFRDRLAATSLSLSISYRCPQSHIKLAQTIVPDIEAAPMAPEGEIARMGTKWKADDFTNEDLVICRAGAPLVQLAYKLLAQRVAVRIMGRDLGQGLVTLIKRLNATDMRDLQDALKAWHDREVSRILARDPEASTDTVDDKRDCIETFMSLFPRKTIEGLCREIENLYTDNVKGILTLATIHKAKGLEANRVWILNSDIGEALMKKQKQAWQVEQEKNLIYVSTTRSKSFLGFIDIERKK